MTRKSGDIPLLPIHRDGPPLYDDVTGASSWNPEYYTIPGSWKDTKGPLGDEKSGVSTFELRFSENPHALYHFISDQLKVPPRVLFHIKGWIGDQSNSGLSQIFNFTLDLTSTLAANPTTDNTEWNEVHIVRDGDGQEVYRGDILKSLEWGRIVTQKMLETSAAKETDGEDENNTLLNSEPSSPEADQPGLMGWCERYCLRTTGAKEFTVSREIQGLNMKELQDELRYYLRQSFQHHKVEVSHSTSDSFIRICSPHWINRLRKNAFVWWFCILTQLWIITAPVVALSLKSYEVVNTAWKVSRDVQDPNTPSGLRKVYAKGRDEANIAGFWAPTMIHAAKCGLLNEEVLTEKDMDRVLRRAQERLDTLRTHGLEESASGSAENARTET